MGKRYSSILDTIGNTPVVRINNLGPDHVNLYAKVESFNPMGSVKDRLALGVIEDAERRGELKPGQTIVEATSGNTGIGLAMVCAQKGYPLVITMAENFSVERRKLMRFLGARVVLTPASEMGSGMVAKARELAEKHGWWQSRQFQNPANSEIHAKTTAVEILDDFADTRLDYWVTGYGTGGTLNGVARVLKAQSPHTRVVVCEPDNAPILTSGIAQARNADGSHSASHPSFRPHLMQGWTPDFIPKLAEEVLQAQHVDDFIPIDGNRALECARDLARREGIFVGISAGATFAGALQIAEQAPEGANILCMLPDTGERYLSTPLFADVSDDMSEEECDISRSTPNYRFDVQPEPAPRDDAVATKRPLDPAAWAEVQELIHDPEQPVVMFGLEWCEFCWSVRKIFEKLNIDYRSINLDSVAYKENERGARMRDVLEQTNNWNTLPQIYIGGQFIGGCTDLFDKFIEGELQALMDSKQVAFNRAIQVDPYQMLPGWLHPR
ncbi:MAG: cysteine synthase A [Thiogranum sp.]|nr:cysteine synthase A [Thiogranum sp.]